MGVLGKQPPRDDFSYSNKDLEDRVRELQNISQKLGVSIEVVANTEISMQLYRLNSILIQDGDKMDENLAGIGEIIASK